MRSQMRCAELLCNSYGVQLLACPQQLLAYINAMAAREIRKVEVLEEISCFGNIVGQEQ